MNTLEDTVAEVEAETLSDTLIDAQALIGTLAGKVGEVAA